MVFNKLPLDGLYLIDLNRLEDERGFFARTFCEKEFEKNGLHSKFPQSNISFNLKKGTIRGMHFQIAPHEEIKIVRCTRGAIFDVVVDLRPTSITYKKWFGVELSDSNRSMLYIPEGFAHGFQTLADQTELFYQMSTAYIPDAARGVRWDDPLLQIQWPLPVSIISQKDLTYASI